MNLKNEKSSSSMRKDSAKEQSPNINVKLFVTHLCPQCYIATDRIQQIVSENPSIDLDVINISEIDKSDRAENFRTITPYYLIEDKYIVPGTASADYLKNVIKSIV